ncbi:subtilase family protein [Aquimarina sp. MAR_2010_214]|uniref:S8 family serine peptidase n=1 Tax=Aquimarina sp. MAR_2010_214 TaxID=1250026 RepID=UPI000C709B7E|nr:S8 family serine peptidase [Aquimarina sp. MAR_2010_214]PKV52032.1 subtilase family protein [Aquimarina sp. MAR_2010_214]
MKIITTFLFCISSVFGYAQKEKKQLISQTYSGITKQQQLTEEELKSWHRKDISNDTIPGVSLDRAYTELLQGKKAQEVIVAVLDTKLDIYHEDIKQQIWVNTDEILDNGIDDDHNGYIDDCNGWDFLSNTKGEYLRYEHFEMVRIVRKYDAVFKDKSEEDIPNDQKDKYKLYHKAKKALHGYIDEEKDFIVYANHWLDTYPKAKKNLKKLFPKEEYTISQLDSILNTTQKDSLIQSYTKMIKAAIKYDLTPELYKDYLDQTEEGLKTTANVDFKEREIIGDNQEDMSNIHYGSNQVYGEVPFPHSISVTGVLAATRNNGIGIKGFSDHIKVMPVVMVASGDEHDKDVAVAIRYAVDNGAKIINMSWGKDFSLHQDWVQDAIRYAAEKDVVLVNGSGNDAGDIDIRKHYPSDYINDKEIVDNFIMVGASSYTLDKKLRASFSNYGKKNVDLFAPGNKMYTTDINNTYDFSRGTSISTPVVSGIAALIRSYYPNLRAMQVKEILMKSGVSYNIDIEIKQKDGSKKLVPFSELSKSGKIVNAYNALLMAEQISKSKN